MTSHPAILDLLEQYIEMQGGGEQWLTVQEFRTHYRMEKNSSREISGILQRIYRNPMFFSPCRVIRIEKTKDPVQPHRTVMKYLVRKHEISRPARCSLSGRPW